MAFLLQRIHRLGCLSIQGSTTLETSIFKHLNEGEVDRGSGGAVIGPYVHICPPYGECSVICHLPSARATEKEHLPSCPGERPPCWSMWDISCSHCSHPRKALGPRPTRMAHHPSFGEEVKVVWQDKGRQRATRAPFIPHEVGSKNKASIYIWWGGGHCPHGKPDFGTRENLIFCKQICLQQGNRSWSSHICLFSPRWPTEKPVSPRGETGGLWG